jgi:hypothetical protein
MRPILFKKVSITPSKFNNVDNISRRDALTTVISKDVSRISGTKNDFVCGYSTYRLTCLGDKMFWKRESDSFFTFKGGKIYGSLSTYTIETLIEGFNLNWIDSGCRRILRLDKRLWTMVLTGKITNPEQLYKRYSKMYFKGVYSYKNLRNAITDHCGCGFSLWDLYYYTTNPNLMIEKLNNISDNDEYYEIRRLIEDCLYYCRIENSKINPSWSLKRLQVEHQAQISRDKKAQIEAVPNTPIAQGFSKDGITLILDERTCFLEGELMHNCVHSCYWRRIKVGRYLLAKGDVDGIHFDLGIDAQSSKYMYIDQIHSIYNGNVSEDIRNYCDRWLKENYDHLAKISDTIKEANVRDYEPLPW